MAGKRIIDIGHPTLRKTAKHLTKADILKPEMQKFVEDMVATLHKHIGVGIAAPQLNKSIQLIVIEHMQDAKKRKKRDHFPLTVLYNPEIIETSKSKEVDWEGCLSIDNGDLLGLVPRFSKIKVKALDMNGEEIELSAQGFKARVLQHEIDHLNGVLFFDRMRKKDISSLTSRKEWEKNYL